MFRNIVFIFIFFALSAHSQTLNYYFGNLHSHSSYSDGNKDSLVSFMTTPFQDFKYAKLSLHTDFYGISEHNHYSAGNRGPLYFQKGLDDADSTTIDGSFIALYGMEWGVISSGGHVLIYGFDSLCGWDFNNEIKVNEADYTKLWKTINRKKSTFAYLAHPQSDDYDNLLNVSVNTNADSAIVGMAMRSGPAFSTNNTYSNPATSNYLTRYNEALKQGYHIGPGLDHDTHNSVFSRQTDGRLVIMSPILNRAELIEGMRRMRFYSSDDWNMNVNFSVNNLPMGSIIKNAGNPTISVITNDLDGESNSSISIYYGIPGSGIAPTLLNSVSNSNTLTYTHQIANNSNYYYYLYIVQSDGDKIWTSPIWYNRNDSTIIQLPIANFESSNHACAGSNFTLLDSSLNEPTSWWWSMPGANPNNSSLQNPEILFSTPGSYPVTLTVTNQAGTSITVTKTITVLSPPTLMITGTTTICKGASVSLNVTGASSYVWSDGSTNSNFNASPTSTTNYSVKGFDGFCYDTALVQVQVNQLLVTPIITRQLNTDTLFSSYSTGNQWFSYTSAIAGATQNHFVPTIAGLYRVQYTDSLGCTSEFSPYYSFSSYSGINNINVADYFKIFPNPTKEYINIQPFINANYLDWEIMDAQGKIIKNSQHVRLENDKIISIDINNIDNGIYLLKLIVDGQVLSRKISKE